MLLIILTVLAVCGPPVLLLLAVLAVFRSTVLQYSPYSEYEAYSILGVRSVFDAPSLLEVWSIRRVQLHTPSRRLGGAAAASSASKQAAAAAAAAAGAAVARWYTRCRCVMRPSLSPQPARQRCTDARSQCSKSER